MSSQSSIRDHMVRIGWAILLLELLYVLLQKDRAIVKYFSLLLLLEKTNYGDKGLYFRLV